MMSHKTHAKCKRAVFCLLPLYCKEDLCRLQQKKGRSHAPRIDLGHGPDRRAGGKITATRCGDELVHTLAAQREIQDPIKKGI